MSQAAVALRLLGPRIPLMLKTTAFQSLGLSQESSKWDLKTALIITMLRSIIAESSSSITRQQRFSLRDPGVKGPLWVAAVTLPAPEDDVRQLLFRAIDEMSSTGHETYTKPTLEPVECEWTGYRAGVGNDKPLPPGLSESYKYTNLMAEVQTDVTILYFHGGAYYLMDPASHRPTVSKLAHLTKGRALSVRYRLAPQHPFPAAVLDCLIAYLSLIYPPPGALHAPVNPSHIIFAGDSAGGNMALALCLLLLHLQHTGQTTLRFHGADVAVPLPGGIAPASPWADVTHALPSWRTNAHYDYLPPTGPDPTTPGPDVLPTHKTPTPPPCAAWPSNPPRTDLYCDGSMMCHPLISPLAADVDMWRGAPPAFISCGEEMLADEAKVVASRLVAAGAQVRWEMYEAMPHVFSAVLVGSKVSERSFEGWAGWMAEVVAANGGRGRDSGGVVPRGLMGGVWIAAKTLVEEAVDVGGLSAMEEGEVVALMRREMGRRNEEFEALQAGEREREKRGKEGARL